jgi:hypothetical protein
VVFTDVIGLSACLAMVSSVVVEAVLVVFVVLAGLVMAFSWLVEALGAVFVVFVVLAGLVMAFSWLVEALGAVFVVFVVLAGLVMAFSWLVEALGAVFVVFVVSVMASSSGGSDRSRVPS